MNNLKIGDNVLMPEPNDTDTYSHQFEGTYIGKHGELSIVRDGNGDTFCIEPERLLEPE